MRNSIISLIPRRRRALGALTAAVVWAIAGTPAALGMPAAWPPGLRMPVGASPAIVALDPATRTLYVTNSNESTVSVVDADACRERSAARCGAGSARLPVGASPLGVAIDPGTHTVYVANSGDGTMSLVDSRACNARHTAGCTGPRATVAIGGAPFGVALDPISHTVYVGNLLEDALSVIDGVRCNASDTSGCGRSPAKVAAGPTPAMPAFDAATDTVYVPDGGTDDTPGSALAVIDAGTCDAHTRAGCGQTPASVTVGAEPVAAFVDASTRTVYVTNRLDGTVSMVDTAACNGHVHSGCAQTPATAPVGGSPDFGLALDPASRTLYVANSGSDTLSALDADHCNARDARGCARRAPTLQVGEVPEGIAVDPHTRTLYVADALDNDLSQFDAAACSATRTTGCRHEAPVAATGGARDLAIDSALHTLYVSRPGADSLALVDTRLCHARRTSGCQVAPAGVPAGPAPVGVALDARTHTLYVDDTGDGTVSVIDAATCNVSAQARCAPVAPPIPVGNGNSELALNPVTRTLYVANGGDDTVSVIDAGSCNAIITIGCGVAAATVPVGEGPRRIGIDTATDTVFVSEFGGGSGHTVSVLDGTRCNAAAITGCSVAATIPVGMGPQGLVVDGSTHTLYVANQAFDDAPGTLSIVDTSLCNGTHTSGCGTTPPTTGTPLGPRALALDPARHTVYTANLGDATASIVAGAACNAVIQAGCGAQPRTVAVGDNPTDIAFDATTGTVYVADAFKSPSDGASDRGVVSAFASALRGTTATRRHHDQGHP
jgi:YVTN family beta-propeller protein